MRFAQSTMTWKYVVFKKVSISKAYSSPCATILVNVQKFLSLSGLQLNRRYLAQTWRFLVEKYINQYTLLSRASLNGSERLSCCKILRQTLLSFINVICYRGHRLRYFWRYTVAVRNFLQIGLHRFITATQRRLFSSILQGHPTTVSS